MNAAPAARAPRERASRERHRRPATATTATKPTASTTPPGRHPAASDVVPPRNIRAEYDTTAPTSRDTDDESRCVRYHAPHARTPGDSTAHRRQRARLTASSTTTATSTITPSPLVARATATHAAA